MRVLLPVAIVALVLALPPAVSGQVVVWTRQFGSAGTDYSTGISVGASGVYVAGLTTGALPDQTSSGSTDTFVRKYDAGGTEAWTRQFGSAGQDYSNGNGISVDASGVYVAGHTNGALPGQTHLGDWDAFVRKYDAAGNVVWTHQFGTSTEDAVFAISVGASGIYAAGVTRGALPGQTSSGNQDAFVRKYDAAGTEVWTRQFGGGSFEQAHAISVDASGVYVAGGTEGALPGQTSSGGHDAWVRKYDASGNEVWTRQFGSASVDLAGGISLDASGVYVTGGTYGALPGQTYTGDQDAFVRKYDAAGTEMWTRQFGTTGNDKVYGVSADASGVHAAGLVTGALPGQTYTGGQDAFVRKYDAAGTEVWTHQFGTADHDGAYVISVDASGVYAAGGTGGALPGQTSSGGADTFVVKLTSDMMTILGFYHPVDMGGVLNTVKNGATVPLKFEVFEGATELTDTSVVESLSLTQVVCTTGLPSDAIEITATGGTSLRYDTTAGQFVYNWQTPKMGGTCWDVTLTVVDGSSITAHFKLR